MINLSPHSCQAVFEVASAHGRRRFELWHADITTLPFPVDLLVVSAFSRDYTPTSSSVIGALHRTGISVSELAVSPAYDFRGSPLQCWVSGILSGPLMPAPDPAPGEVAEVPRYGRILCLEMVPSDRLRGLGQLFSGIFGVQSMLESQLEQVAPVRVMALPALGAGDQSFPVSMVVDALVGAATAALEGARYLERIVWVSKSRSDVDAFRVALEARLGRVRVPMRTEPVIAARRDLIEKVVVLLRSPDLEQSGRRVLADLQRLLEWDAAGNFELGIAGRKAAEVVVEMLLRKKGARSGDLLRNIELLGEVPVADWVRSYLHTLRVFGNESAHSKQADRRLPAELDERDLELWCHCLRRVLEFWGEVSRTRAGGTDKHSSGRR